MPFELAIALRYLFSKSKHRFISLISWMAVLGVGLGVGALIVVMGVMNGFSANLRDKILGVNAQIIVNNFQGTFTGYQKIARNLEKTPEIIGVMPFIYSEVMLSSPHGVKGAALKGIEPQAAKKVLHLSKDLVQGSLDNLLSMPQDLPGIIIGQDMAQRLGLSLGSMVNVLSPSGGKSAAGFTPKIKVFLVQGIFDTGVFEYDSSLVYTSLSAAQDLLGFKQDLASGLEIRIKDVYQAQQVKERIAPQLAFPFYVQTWMEMNKSLFSALKLEKTAMAVILIMIILVGSFSIVTTLIMLVMEKQKEIAVLMSLGARPGNVRKIFIWQGTLIGLVGTGLGFVLGLGLCLLLEKYHFIHLPQDIYYLDHLPIQIQGLDLAVICCIALVLCFLATLYPAGKAAKINPAEVLRYE